MRAAKKKDVPADVIPAREVLEDLSAMTEEQQIVLRYLKTDEAMLSDQVAEGTELPVRRVLSALTLLEIDGYVRKIGARSFVRLVDIK